jgi:serine/threonine protein kinase
MFRVLDTNLRLCIGVDIARGMHYLHETANRPVIHRDLNPNNVLIHLNGKAVVSDFGESRFMTENEEDSMTKQPGNQCDPHIHIMWQSNISMSIIQGVHFNSASFPDLFYALNDFLSFGTKTMPKPNKTQKPRITTKPVWFPYLTVT